MPRAGKAALRSDAIEMAIASASAEKFTTCNSFKFNETLSNGRPISRLHRYPVRLQRNPILGETTWRQKLLAYVY